MIKTKDVLLLAATVLCFIALSGTATAQDDEEEGRIVTVSTFQWPFDNLEEIFTMMEEDKDLVEKNEFMLNQRVLTHRWAGDFSVMLLTEYASMADIEKGQERADELFEAKYPDETVREAREARMSELTGTRMHVDSILVENPALAK